MEESGCNRLIAFPWNENKSELSLECNWQKKIELISLWPLQIGFGLYVQLHDKNIEHGGDTILG